jgi:hypothetical protein
MTHKEALLRLLPQKVQDYIEEMDEEVADGYDIYDYLDELEGYGNTKAYDKYKKLIDDYELEQEQKNKPKTPKPETPPPTPLTREEIINKIGKMSKIYEIYNILEDNDIIKEHKLYLELDDITSGFIEKAVLPIANEHPLDKRWKSMINNIKRNKENIYAYYDKINESPSYFNGSNFELAVPPRLNKFMEKRAIKKRQEDTRQKEIFYKGGGLYI